MDHDFISLILHGINLAKDLEPSLQNLGTQQLQAMLSNKLDEIIRVFITAKERLSAQEPSLYQPTQNIDPSLQEYLLRTKSMMELFQTQRRSLLDIKPPPPSSSSGGGLAMELGGSSTDIQPPLQRPRRRKGDAEKRTITVPAPRMGNTEIPPEDGYTWRKYGQKEILGSKYPRGYYRCTHQKMYNCPAKKHVQRLDDDPYTFEVTYRGDHTCHMSATAPSIPPPEITQEMPQAAYPPPWLEFNLGGSSSCGPGPSSTVRYGKEAHEYPVADLADAMFNSGSSSTNTMELIFSSMEDKWEQGDKKN